MFPGLQLLNTFVEWWWVPHGRNKSAKVFSKTDGPRLLRQAEISHRASSSTLSGRDTSSRSASMRACFTFWRCWIIGSWRGASGSTWFHKGTPFFLKNHSDIHETDFLTKFNIIHEQWYMQLYNLATLCNPGNNIAAIQYIIQQKTSCHDVSWLSSPFNRLEFYMPRVTMLAMWDFVNMDQFVWK